LAEISPFQGIRYNSEMVGDMSAVICPPYDIISPQQQQAYYEKSEYNIIRVEHGISLPDDTAAQNKYSRSRATLGEWLNKGVLRVDTAHTFYIYEQGFVYRDVKKRRRGLIACVRLEPWERRTILPHENTRQRDKDDRLELMRATNANVSPILGMYDDPGMKVTKIMMERELPGKLLIDIEHGDNTHKIWKANEPEFVQRVSHFFNPKSIYIADGHHRYETGLTYRDEKKAQTGSSNEYDGFNFIMMTLVSFSDPGIVMLPVHRLVKGIPSEQLSTLLERLNTFFEITASPIGSSDLHDDHGIPIRILGLQEGQVVNLKLRPSAVVDDAMPKARSSVYKKLNVSIVEHLILESILGLPEEKENVVYTPDFEMARRTVEQGEYQLAFLLSPLPVTTIKAISDAGDRMPKKSTYFYPKLPTGLVINSLDRKL
jgi:uncharacterized protein (DUF1015 family)